MVNIFQTTIQASNNDITIKLQGKLAGESVRQLLELWERVKSARLQNGIRVDLTGVHFCDEDGKSLLRSIRASGGQLVAEDELTTLFLDEMIQRQSRGLKRIASG
jgi:anti-anti-sigma regulatory factor